MHRCEDLEQDRLQALDRCDRALGFDVVELNRCESQHARDPLLKDDYKGATLAGLLALPGFGAAERKKRVQAAE